MGPAFVIELKFADTGEAFRAAKATADSLGMSVKDYLLLCISEGHKTLTTRALLESGELEFPTFERRGSSAFTSDGVGGFRTGLVKDDASEASAPNPHESGGEMTFLPEVDRPIQLDISTLSRNSAAAIKRNLRIFWFFRRLWKALR